MSELNPRAHQLFTETFMSRWLLCDWVETGSSCGQRRAPTLQWDLTVERVHLHERDNLASTLSHYTLPSASIPNLTSLFRL
ncbi:hypothetical protein QQF64_006024 [Cirrhinus molitorella]|uniref:Uncharacterized protein n=1 Tax=Cirrhinus molitorella TaxID=172907 RepID=A0ABR3MDX2_9TELE